MQASVGDFIVEFAFGDIHCRPGLTAREREMIILSVLTTLGGCEPQIRAHIRAMRVIDVPFAEIEEVLLQTAPYCGVARVVNAMKVLREEQEGDLA